MSKPMLPRAEAFFLCPPQWQAWCEERRASHLVTDEGNQAINKICSLLMSKLVPLHWGLEKCDLTLHVQWSIP